MVEQLEKTIKKIVIPKFPIEEFRVASDKSTRSTDWYKIKVVYQIRRDNVDEDLLASLDSLTKNIVRSLDSHVFWEKPVEINTEGYFSFLVFTFVIDPRNFQ